MLGECKEQGTSAGVVALIDRVWPVKRAVDKITSRDQSQSVEFILCSRLYKHKWYVDTIYGRKYISVRWFYRCRVRCGMTKTDGG